MIKKMYIDDTDSQYITTYRSKQVILKYTTTLKNIKKIFLMSNFNYIYSNQILEHKLSLHENN